MTDNIYVANTVRSRLEHTIDGILDASTEFLLLYRY